VKLLKAILLLTLVSTSLFASFPLSINQTFNGAGSRTPLLLNNYPGAAAAYSLQEISNLFVGVDIIRVRRGGDNVESDFTATEITDGTLETFTVTGSGDGEGHVTKWYDQSGNNVDASQATAGSQGTIVTGGSLIEVNGNPAVLSDSSTVYTFTNQDATGDWTTIGVASRDAATDRLTYIGSNASTQPYPMVLWSDGKGYIDDGKGYYTITDSTTGQVLITSIKDDSANTNTVSINGALQNLGSRVGSPVTEGSFGRICNGSNSSLVGHFQETILYLSDQSSNRAAIESEINTRYSIYSDYLLNNYTGAAAAYSLAELSSDFVGVDILRVRRGGDNVEDDFTATGITDGTLATWTTAGSGDGEGYITTWYDQSGNADNLTIAAATEQPIVVSTGTLVTDTAGNPAWSHTGGRDAMINTSLAGLSRLDSYFIMDRDGDTTYITIGDNLAGPRYGFYANTGVGTTTLHVDFGTPELWVNGSQETVTTIGEVATAQAGANITAYIDGTTALWTEFAFASWTSGAEYSGKANTLIFYDRDTSSDVANISSALNSLFSNTYY